MESPPPAASESMNLLREPDAGNPHVRFDERDVETEHNQVPPRHVSTLPFRISIAMPPDLFEFSGHQRGRQPIVEASSKIRVPFEFP